MLERNTVVRTLIICQESVGLAHHLKYHHQRCLLRSLEEDMHGSCLVYQVTLQTGIIRCNLFVLICDV